MNVHIARRIALVGWLASTVTTAAIAQQPAGGIPGVSPAQMRAVAEMTAAIAPIVNRATAARDQLTAATFAMPRNDAAIRAAADALAAAERTLAEGRADAFAAVQSASSRLAPGQVAALVAMGGSFLRSTAGRGGNPPLTEEQRTALARITTELQPRTDAVTRARSDVVAASLTLPRDARSIGASVDALMRAEAELADARAAKIATLQATRALSRDQVAALVVLGGTLRTTGLPFTEPDPADFNDHEGYTPLFDGVSLKGWDGNPAIWRVENGAIVGESTVERPTGNSYLAYRALEARDFTLKLEIKTEGSGGTGIQYRSRTGLPWLGNTAGTPNLAWMMTGPQADFWPMSPVYTGQFYSENTPMRVLAWRGQVVEGFGAARKRLIGTIGDRHGLGAAVKPDDWNEYVIIARGGTCLHIINGQLMAVMIDDDPRSSNNQAGEIGIEIEQITRVSVRNIWLKRLQ